MQLLTISQVSKNYGVSPRMLRYYEQAGLLHSKRKEDYAYRVYDENNLTRLRQVIILRKLRVPLRQIASILNNSDAVETVEFFRQNIEQLDDEMTSLATIKSILLCFVDDITRKTDIKLKLLGDEEILLSSLSFSDNKIRKPSNKTKKSGISIDDLSKASQRLNKYEDKDIRIVFLPPMTVAAAYASGDECEGKAAKMIQQFVNDSGLFSIKPDARSFGFDCSQGTAKVGSPSRTYEMWVSIPDDMQLPAPLVRREFSGGMYAAHVLTNWDFTDWQLLGEWVNASDKYDNDWGTPRWMSEETVFGQGFEEILNFVNYLEKGRKMTDLQLDLLFPVKEKVGTV